MSDCSGQLPSGAITVDMEGVASVDDLGTATDSGGTDLVSSPRFLVCSWLFAVDGGSSTSEKTNSAASFRGTRRGVEPVT